MRLRTLAGSLLLTAAAHPGAAVEVPPRMLVVIAHPDDDAGEALRQWDAARVAGRLREILDRGQYSLVLIPLPRATTHGAHQAAAQRELYYVFDVNEPAALAEARALLARLGPPRPEFPGETDWATRWPWLGRGVCPIPR
jgi:LmbE family N-acetylglucosaminyl deacetylase